MVTAAQAEQNPAYVSTPPIKRTHHYLTVVMGFLLYIDVNDFDFLRIFHLDISLEQQIGKACPQYGGDTA